MTDFFYGSEVVVIVGGSVIGTLIFGYLLNSYFTAHIRVSRLEDTQDAEEDAIDGIDGIGVSFGDLPNLSLLHTARIDALIGAQAPLLEQDPPKGIDAPIGGSNPATATATATGGDLRRRSRRRRRNLRRVLLALLAIAFCAGLAVGIYFLIQETVKQPGAAGFEATERYHGIIECGGHTIMVTRMRVFSYGKFAVVLRYLGDENAYVHSAWHDAAFNPGLYCYKNTSYLIGSASSELHLAGGPPPGETKVYNIDTGESFTPSMEYSSCTDLFFKDCSMDGKFSVVTEPNNTLRAYIRANAWPTGGGRWAQTTTSDDGGRTWSSFQLIVIDGVGIEATTNIYTFLAVRFNATHLRARYPAVTPDGSGIWQTYSTDGVKFSSPSLLRSGHAHGPRVDLHPVEYGVGNAVTDLTTVRINLHLPTHVVALYNFNGELELDSRWKTRRFVWV